MMQCVQARRVSMQDGVRREREQEQREDAEETTGGGGGRLHGSRVAAIWLL
jgi:hypothetical protein